MNDNYIEPYEGYFWEPLRKDIARLKTKLTEIIGSYYYKPQFANVAGAGFSFYFVTDKNAELDKPIEMPLLVTLADTRYVVIDIRSNIKESYKRDIKTKSPNDMNIYEYVRDRHLYEFQMITAFQMLDMITAKNTIGNIKDDAIKIFGKWVSFNIIKRTTTTPQEELVITSCMEFYYYLMTQRISLELLGKNQSLKNSDLNYYKMTFLHKWYPNNDIVKLVINGADIDLENKYLLEETMAVFKSNINNIALKELNTGILSDLLAQSWIGWNRDDIVKMALTNIPVFLAMVYISLSGKSFNMTGFYKMLQLNKHLKRNEEDFLLRFKALKSKYEVLK